MRRPTARELAMDILTKVEQEQAYSNLLLNQMLQKHKLERLDAGLATEIVYGTIQRRNTIDYFLNQFATKGIAKLNPWVRNLLRLSFYQLYYLERIPVHAIVNEAVNIAKKRGHKGISGLVNGILRNIVRSKDRLMLPTHLAVVQRIALTHSHPEWIVSRWIAQFGEQVAEAICEANNEPPQVSVRVNAVKHRRDALMERMRKQHVEAEPSQLSEEGILIKNGGNMAFSEWFERGDITIQDESSMLVGMAVDPQPGMDVLDCCAAPGGKTTHLAELMNNQGKVWANDLHPHKQKLIEDQAKRLGLNCIETTVHDALHLASKFPTASFDRILVDAPCSGLGVIRRKPDLKWMKTESDIKALPALQLSILSEVAQLLHRDGALVYSTCTLETEENEGVIEAFLEAHPQFELDRSLTDDVTFRAIEKRVSSDGMIRILPQYFKSDGFFIAKLKHKQT